MEYIIWLLRQICVYAAFVAFALGFVKAGWKYEGKKYIPDWKALGIMLFLIAWTVLG